MNGELSMKSNVVSNTMSMAYRSLLKTMHNPEKLFDVVIQPTVFMIMLSYVFGGAISGNVKAYLPIIVPGILVQTIISATAGSGPQIKEDMETGVFDRFKSLPIAPIAPLAGQLFADILRLLIATTASLVTGYILGWRSHAGIGYVLLAAVLVIFSGWALGWIFAFLGLIANNATTVSTFSMIITMILSFLSNSFVSIKTFPKWLKLFANINPVTYIIKAFTSLVNHGTWNNECWMVLVIGVIVVAIFAPLTVLVYNRKS